MKRLRILLLFLPCCIWLYISWKLAFTPDLEGENPHVVLERRQAQGQGRLDFQLHVSMKTKPPPPPSSSFQNQQFEKEEEINKDTREEEGAENRDIDDLMAESDPEQDPEDRDEELEEEEDVSEEIEAVYNESKVIYTCGYKHDRLRQYLFPEYTEEVEYMYRIRRKPGALLFHGLLGPCPQWALHPKINETWIHRWWRGKALMINGEGSHVDARSENSYQIGVVPDSPRSVGVTFLAIAFISHYPEETWPLLFNHSRKPKSSGKRYLIYAASKCLEYREKAADRLAQIAPGSFYAGKCEGGGRRLRQLRFTERKLKGPKEARWSSNYRMYSGFKFCLVMENEKHSGYITEKILNAFLGGCIPIYYGTEEVFDIFNKNSFVYYNISDPQPAYLRVKQIMLNASEYRRIQNEEPILRDGEHTIEKYFSLADHVGRGYLKQKIRALMDIP